jgi:hypothetical protein
MQRALLRGLGQLPRRRRALVEVKMSIYMGKVVRHSCYGLPVPFTAKKISGNEVRVPDPKPGEATVISRYGKERAIVIHPTDFTRLNELDELLTVAAALEPIELSDDAIRAHGEEGAPGEPVTDPALLAELFG